jgi:hypothetical protein
MSLAIGLGNQGQLTLIVDTEGINQTLVVSASAFHRITSTVSEVNVPRLSAGNQCVLVVAAGLFFDGTSDTVLVLGSVVSNFKPG